MTDPADADLEAVDRLVDQIEALFSGKLMADCVFALATAFGRCVAINEDIPREEQVRMFLEVMLLEAGHVRKREHNAA